MFSTLDICYMYAGQLFPIVFPNIDVGIDTTFDKYSDAALEASLEFWVQGGWIIVKDCIFLLLFSLLNFQILEWLKFPQPPLTGSLITYVNRSVGRGGGAEFGISVNPIQVRGQSMPLTQLPAPPDSKSYLHLWWMLWKKTFKFRNNNQKYSTNY